jgi:hypothetical protein
MLFKALPRNADQKGMGVLTRGVGVLIGVALLAAAGTAGASDGNDLPIVSGTGVTSVGGSSAVLRGNVNPNDRPTTFLFEYGTTTAYGSTTAQGSLAKSKSNKPVSANIVGLEAETTYHFRLVATNSKGTTRGPDVPFTTLSSGTPPPPDPGPTEPTPDPTPDPGPAPLDDRLPTPELGSTVIVAPGQGDLRVRRPGTSKFVPLSLGTELPVGTEVDAREGSVALTSALPSGKLQTASFGGGRFVIRQKRSAYVDLYLRGRACPRATAKGSRTLASAASTKPGRRLWGRDHGGRYRTHGKNSHATVRGTRWVVIDTCAGTLTRVSRGAVVVTDQVRHKRIALDAGEHYLARPPR